MESCVSSIGAHSFLPIGQSPQAAKPVDRTRSFGFIPSLPPFYLWRAFAGPPRLGSDRYVVAKCLRNNRGPGARLDPGRRSSPLEIDGQIRRWRRSLESCARYYFPSGENEQSSQDQLTGINRRNVEEGQR